MSAITLAAIEPLLHQFTGAGTVLSGYADFGPGEGFRRDWRDQFSAKTDALSKTIGDNPSANVELKKNLTTVRRGLEAAEADGARWAAVFSAAQRNFTATFVLDVPTQCAFVLDRSPYLVPLLAAAHRRREYLAVHTDTHHGRIYSATPAGAHLVAEIEGDAPKHQHSTGQRFGYEQATIARHREDRILHYRKELTHELEKLWTGGSYTGLILLGAHEILEHVRTGLPARLAGCVLRELPESLYESEAHVEEKVRAVATELFDEQEAEVAPDFWDLLREGKALSGAGAVITALQSGHFGVHGHGYIVLGPDPREAAGRCVACRTLARDPLGPCPRCSAPCAPGSLWEEVLLTALRHGITARFVSDPRKLEPYGGIVAVLPKPEQNKMANSA